MQEYADEHGEDDWPFVKFVGDMLRASVVCTSMDGVADAWKRISSEDGFDVREGHGRLKNNWLTTEPRPPDQCVLIASQVSSHDASSS